LEKYGHPDGKQEFSVGIAIPKWIVESKNNGWVLVLYGLIFGGGLPFLVGKWWYGSRQYTKDGVKGRTAELFFKTVKEESEADELVQTVSKAWRFEGGAELKAPPEMEIKDLKKVVRERLGSEKDTFAKVRRPSSSVEVNVVLTFTCRLNTT
jgi:translocation protein SEC63